MKGIENITRRIDQDAQAEIDAVLDKARSDAAEVTAQYQAQADAQRRELTAKNEKAAAEREERLVSAARMEARKVALAARQEMVDKAYDLALEKLCAMPRRLTWRRWRSCWHQAAPDGQGEVILNPQVSGSMGPGHRGAGQRPHRRRKADAFQNHAGDSGRIHPQMRQCRGQRDL